MSRNESSPESSGPRLVSAVTAASVTVSGSCGPSSFSSSGTDRRSRICDSASAMAARSGRKQMSPSAFGDPVQRLRPAHQHADLPDLAEIKARILALQVAPE